MARLEDLEVVEPKDRKAWRRWLEKNHAKSPGVMLVVSKKGSARRTLSYFFRAQGLIRHADPSRFDDALIIHPALLGLQGLAAPTDN